MINSKRSLATSASTSLYLMSSAQLCHGPRMATPAESAAGPLHRWSTSPLQGNTPRARLPCFCPAAPRHERPDQSCGGVARAASGGCNPP